MNPLSVRHAPSGAAPTLAEVFAVHAANIETTALAGVRLRPGTQVLWVQVWLFPRERERLFVAGLGVSVEMLHLGGAQARDALWATKQAAGRPALAAVAGEVWGEPRALDVTATRRLAMRAEARWVRAWLIRRAACPVLGVARERWTLASRPSAPPWDNDAPGEPSWRAILLRAQGGRTGKWAMGPRRPGDPAFVEAWAEPRRLARQAA